MPLLIVTANDTKISQRFLVREARFAIGRLRSSAVPIRDKSVSKTHVMISRTPTGYIFQDLFSRNGTFLNEERCDSGALRSGDVLRLGRINITFLIDESMDGKPGAAAPPAAVPIPDTSLILASSAHLPPAAAFPPGREERSENHSRAGTDLVLQRSTERRIRWLVAAGTCAIGLGIGFMIARMESSAPGKVAAKPQTSDLKAPRSPLVAAGGDGGQEAGPDLVTPADDAEAPDPSEDARDRKAVEELRDGLRRAYSDPDESRRVLYRLFLDLIDRSPTRAEERELLPLDLAGRWRRIAAMARSIAGGTKATEPTNALEWFRRFLGRKPTLFEERALTEATAISPASDNVGRSSGGESIEVGLLLAASREYRSADFRRPKSPRQRARSLIVDLTDRPPAGEGEAQDVEQALERFPAGKVARVLVSSPEGCRSLPALANGPPGARPEPRSDLREWVRSETQRFLLRSVSESELDRLMEEVGQSDQGPGRLRIALATLAEYRSY